jgi:hypothetical protein
MCVTQSAAEGWIGHLKSWGWEHTATIDPAAWIQEVCNGYDYEALSMISELKTMPKSSSPYYTGNISKTCFKCIHFNPGFCLLRGKPMKNMDVKTCSAWTANESK